MLSVSGAYLHLATQPRLVWAKQTQSQRFAINHSYRNAGFSYEDSLLFQFIFISATARANYTKLVSFVLQYEQAPSAPDMKQQRATTVALLKYVLNEENCALLELLCSVQL